MLKVVSLLKRKEDMSLEEFRKWALEEHPPLGKKLPGIRHYRMSVVLEDNPDLPYHAVSEFWFDDEAARAAAFATPEGNVPFDGFVCSNPLGYADTKNSTDNRQGTDNTQNAFVKQFPVHNDPLS